MTLLLIFLFGAMAISFMCSLLESTLMSTPLSYINMREDEGYKHATRFKSYKTDNARPTPIQHHCFKFLRWVL